MIIRYIYNNLELKDNKENGLCNVNHESKKVV